MSFFFQTVAGILRGSYQNTDYSASHHQCCKNHHHYISELAEIPERRKSYHTNQSDSVTSQKSGTAGDSESD